MPVAFPSLPDSIRDRAPDANHTASGYQRQRACICDAGLFVTRKLYQRSISDRCCLLSELAVDSSCCRPTTLKSPVQHTVYPNCYFLAFCVCRSWQLLKNCSCSTAQLAGFGHGSFSRLLVTLAEAADTCTTSTVRLRALGAHGPE